MGSRYIHRKRQFWGQEEPIVHVSIGIFCRELCNIGWTDWFAVWIVDSGGPKEAQVQSYSPGGANVPTWEGTLTPPCEYKWTVRLRRRCGLMSNYFDHFLYLIPTLYFHCNHWPLFIYLCIPVAAYMYAVVILNTLCLLTCIHRVLSARLESIHRRYSVGSSDCLDIRRQLGSIVSTSRTSSTGIICAFCRQWNAFYAVLFNSILSYISPFVFFWHYFRSVAVVFCARLYVQFFVRISACLSVFLVHCIARSHYILRLRIK